MKLIKEFVSNSPNETADFAEKMGETLKPSTVIAFEGDLGAGKTLFTSGLAKGVGFNGATSSPTFALVNEYRGGRLTLYHFDMYRIESFEDLMSTGFFDYLDMGAVIAAEWSENIAAALPEETITVRIEKLSENGRKISVFEGADI